MNTKQTKRSILSGLNVNWGGGGGREGGGFVNIKEQNVYAAILCDLCLYSDTIGTSKKKSAHHELNSINPLYFSPQQLRCMSLWRRVQNNLLKKTTIQAIALVNYSLKDSITIQY